MGPSVKFVLAIIDSISKKKMGVNFSPQNWTRRGGGSEGFVSNATKFRRLNFWIFPLYSRDKTKTFKRIWAFRQICGGCASEFGGGRCWWRIRYQEDSRRFLAVKPWFLSRSAFAACTLLLRKLKMSISFRNELVLQNWKMFWHSLSSTLTLKLEVSRALSLTQQGNPWKDGQNMWHKGPKTITLVKISLRCVRLTWVGSSRSSDLTRCNGPQHHVFCLGNWW